MRFGIGQRPSDGTRPRTRIAILIAATLAALVAAALPASAGTISLGWNPVFANDLAGYRVYYGTEPQSLDQVLEVAPGQTTAVIGGLTDCIEYQAKVYAFDEEGLESRAPSRTIRGWARPIVSSVSPNSVLAGETVELTISGTNFYPGSGNAAPTTIEIETPGITVLSTTVDDCFTMRAQVRVDVTAGDGASDIWLYNPDLTHGNPHDEPRVFRRVLNGLTVIGIPPEVTSVAPAAGSGGADPDVRPAITFNEPIDPSSVSQANVRLVGETGRVIPQAAGSPQVAGSVVTIFPADVLAEGIYHVEVDGGASGVRDLGGTALEGVYVQSPGFSVAGNGDGAPPPVVLSASPDAGEIDVPRTLQEVRVTFDRDMTPLFDAVPQGALADRFFVTRGRDILPHASNSPHLEGSGRTVVIVLADALLDGESYTTNVQLSGESLSAELTAVGVSTSFLMDQAWSTRPSWRVEGGLENVAWRDTELNEGSSLLAGAPSLDASNTGVSLDAEFLVTFSQPVAAESATAANFRVLVQSGRRYEAVEIREPLALEDGGRTLVLTPVERLPAGAQAVIDIRTGPRGVVLDGPQGQYTLGAGALQAPFATEVSGAGSQAIGLGECVTNECMRSDLR